MFSVDRDLLYSLSPFKPEFNQYSFVADLLSKKDQ